MKWRTRVYCETEGGYQFKDTLRAVEQCPNDPAHAVRAGSLCQIEGAVSDYKKVRAELYVWMIAQGGFAALAASDQKLASQHFIVEKADRDTVHTLNEQISFGVEFHKRSVESRMEREKRAAIEVFNRLTWVEANDIIDDTQSLVDLYLNRGREGTVEGDPEGLFDYIDSRAGTSYAGGGMRNKVFIPAGMANMSVLADKMLDILKNGNY